MDNKGVFWTLYQQIWQHIKWTILWTILSNLTLEKINKTKTIHLLKIGNYILNFTTKKMPGPDGFTADFYLTLQEELISISHTIFHNIEGEGMHWTQSMKSALF